jgi:hypothetical protein
MQALRNSIQLAAFVLATSCATAVLVLAGLGVL